MIYGASEASRFYFDKTPSQLTTEEAIFMASIIPKPKHFRSSFDANMQLKPWLGSYYRLIANRLSRKGLISAEEAANIQPAVQVTGTAVNNFPLPKDTVTVILPPEENKE